MKSAYRFGHSKEKKDLHASLHHEEYGQYQKYLLKLSGDYKLNFQSPGFLTRLSGGTTIYWKSKSSSILTKPKSLELILEHTLRLAYPTFALFDPHVLFYLPTVIRIGRWEVRLPKHVEKIPL